ncbi:MAG: hypothetical protein KJ901_07445 [Gammaproteobacteria bacterium]|nr:hypothetical protein [Gammaproteobacteria bacterium]MBU1443377.1 hypothetical protein [Gammaproteobacteria bacterium]
MLSRGGGTDWVWDDDAAPGDIDIARFGSDVAADQLWFRQLGNSLEVSIIGTDDKLVVQGWYADGRDHRIEQFRTGDGRVLFDRSVHNLVEAMAGFEPPAAGQTTLSVSYQGSLGRVIASHWQ